MNKIVSRKKMFYWALYDWAVTPYNTVIVTFIFATYFASKVAQTGVQGASMLGYANSIAGFLMALCSILLGPIVDKAGGHKKWIAGCSAAVVIASVALFFTQPTHDYIYWALIWFAIGLFFAELVVVFYNAMLSKCFPAKTAGVLSGWGWGFSYLGGLFCLALMLVIDHFWVSGAMLARLSGLIVAAWLIVFSLPFFFGCSDVKKEVSAPKKALSIAKLIADMKAYPKIALFLLARMFYMDGLNTTLAFAAIYAVGVFKIKMMTVLLFGISINLIAGVGAIVFGWVEQFVGPKRMVHIGLTVMLVSMIALLLVSDFNWFWGIAAVYGLCLGPIQSSSRSLLCHLCPKEIVTEMFGFYSLSGRITTFLGPLLLGVLTAAFNSQRVGMLSAVGLMLIGWVLMFWLKAPETKPGFFCPIKG